MEYLKKNRCCNYYMELELIWCSYENISFEEEQKRELERVFEDLQKRKEEYIIKKIAVYDDYVRLGIAVTLQSVMFAKECELVYWIVAIGLIFLFYIRKYRKRVLKIHYNIENLVFCIINEKTFIDTAMYI